MRQEQFRPFIPNVVMEGVGPGGAFEGSVFGGGPDGGPQHYGGRFDMDVAAIWTLNNLGAGNRALVHQRVAQQQRASIEFANLQDQVAQEVVQAHAQLKATTADERRFGQAWRRIRSATDFARDRQWRRVQ